MDADNFIFLNFDAAMRLARVQGLIEILPPLDETPSLNVRLTDRGKEVYGRLREQLPKF